VTRTFIALLIPDAWIAYLRDVARALQARTSGFSWVKPENIHLTVRFLGDLDDSGVARARESVRRSAAGLSAPMARLGRLGAFPRMDRPRVLWLGLSRGEKEVGAIAAQVNGGLERDGFGPLDKPFRAHLTVARARDQAVGPDESAASTDALPEPPPASPLERLAVMKSELHPSGARYNVLEELRLPEPAP
jgi:2'-5' RNA ligase